MNHKPKTEREFFEAMAHTSGLMEEAKATNWAGWCKRYNYLWIGNKPPILEEYIIEFPLCQVEGKPVYEGDQVRYSTEWVKLTGLYEDGSVNVTTKCNYLIRTAVDSLGLIHPIPSKHTVTINGEKLPAPMKNAEYNPKQGTFIIVGSRVFQFETAGDCKKVEDVLKHILMGE